MKFKTIVEGQDVQIETIHSPHYVPFRAEEIPSRELLKEIQENILSYYQLYIRVGEHEFYNDGILLAVEDEEHQEELEEYIDEEDIIENIFEYLQITE